MRNPNRIYPIVDEFTKIWEMYPDLRFWQLIEMLKDGKDRFYVEDDVTFEIFKQINEELT